MISIKRNDAIFNDQKWHPPKVESSTGRCLLDDEELSDFLFYLFILVMSQSKWLIEKEKKLKKRKNFIQLIELTKFKA